MTAAYKKKLEEVMNEGLEEEECSRRVDLLKVSWNFYSLSYDNQDILSFKKRKSLWFWFLNWLVGNWYMMGRSHTQYCHRCKIGDCTTGACLGTEIQRLMSGLLRLTVLRLQLNYLLHRCASIKINQRISITDLIWSFLFMWLWYVNLYLMEVSPFNPPSIED